MKKVNSFFQFTLARTRPRLGLRAHSGLWARSSALPAPRQQPVQDAALPQRLELRRVLTDDGDAPALPRSRQVALAVGQRAQQAVVLIGGEVVPATPQTGLTDRASPRTARPRGHRLEGFPRHNFNSAAVREPLLSDFRATAPASVLTAFLHEDKLTGSEAAPPPPPPPPRLKLTSLLPPQRPRSPRPTDRVAAFNTALPSHSTR